MSAPRLTLRLRLLNPGEPVGWMAAAVTRRGKSGLHGDTAPDKVRRGRPQGKRHRKQTAARRRSSSAEPRAARVKGCGKSAPLGRQRTRHGKPRREQDRIGATGSASSHPVSGPSPGLVARGGRRRPSQRNGHHARAVKPPAPYRTRLTGRLALYFCEFRRTCERRKRALRAAPPRCQRSLNTNKA